jgi:hypothetical protein
MAIPGTKHWIVFFIIYNFLLLMQKCFRHNNRRLRETAAENYEKKISIFVFYIIFSN